MRKKSATPLKIEVHSQENIDQRNDEDVELQEDTHMESELANSKKPCHQKCRICLKYISKNYTDHALTHLSSIRPYTCYVCQSSFIQCCNAKTHFFTIHPNAVFVPFVRRITKEENALIEAKTEECFPEKKRYTKINEQERKASNPMKVVEEDNAKNLELTVRHDAPEAMDTLGMAQPKETEASIAHEIKPISKKAAYGDNEDSLTDADDLSISEGLDVDTVDLPENEERAGTARQPCKLCGKSIKIYRLQHRHAETHLKIKKYQCVVCRRNFSNSHANRHFSRNHKQEIFVPFRNITLTDEEKALVQLKAKECFPLEWRDEIRKYRKKCELCNKMISLERASNKTHHALTHSSIRPYTCAICPTTFIHSWNVNYHYRVKHPQEVFAQCRKTITEEERSEIQTIIDQCFPEKGSCTKAGNSKRKAIDAIEEDIMDDLELLVRNDVPKITGTSGMAQSTVTDISETSSETIHAHQIPNKNDAISEKSSPKVVRVTMDATTTKLNSETPEPPSIATLVFNTKKSSMPIVDLLDSNLMELSSPSAAVHPHTPPQTITKTIDALQLAKNISHLAFRCKSNTWLKRANKQINCLMIVKNKTIELVDFSINLIGIMARMHLEVVRKSEAQPGSMEVTEFLNLIKSIVLFPMVELVKNELALVEEEDQKFNGMEEEWSIPMTTVEAALQTFLRLTWFFF